MATKTRPIFNIEQLESDLRKAEIQLAKLLWFGVGFVAGIGLVILMTF